MHNAPQFGAGVPSPDWDPQGLYAYPGNQPWLERMLYDTEMQTADVVDLSNTDADFVDSVEVPGVYNTLIAGAGSPAPHGGTPMYANHPQAAFGARPPMAPNRQAASQAAQYQATQYQAAQPIQRAPAEQAWQKTARVAFAAPTAAGAFTATVRPQYDFVAQDMVADGSTATGIIVQSVVFGDYIAWNEPQAGVPAATINGTSFLRGLIKGAKVKGGLDITCQGTVTGAGNVYLTIVGLKPATGMCG